MKPLIFEYAEIPQDENLEIDHIEYNSDLSLNVMKSTGLPAVNECMFITETFTRAQVDTSENDDDLRLSIKLLLDTRIYTKQMIDDTGGDDNRIGLKPRSSN